MRLLNFLKRRKSHKDIVRPLMDVWEQLENRKDFLHQTNQGIDVVIDDLRKKRMDNNLEIIRCHHTVAALEEIIGPSLPQMQTP